MKTTFAALAMLGTACAAALEGRTSSKHSTSTSSSHSTSTSSKSNAQCVTYTDTYDDLTANAVPLLSPIGTYHGLTYEGFVVASVVNGLGGVIPESAPNVAVASMETDVEIGSVSLTPFGSITTGPGVKSFNLYSFYFGCIVDLHTGVADTSEGCTIAVTGFYTNGQQVPEATFAFAPTSPTAAPLVLATLPYSYIGLKNVTFGVANGAVLTSGTALDLDNLVHCNNQ